MRNGFLVVLACFGLWAQSAGVHNEKLCAGFLPPNNMYIPEKQIVATGITRAKYDEVLDRLQAIYEPIFAAKGGKLKIERLWSNGAVNAYADRRGNTWTIGMFGGFARHPEVTFDAFAAVACHELGHHVGGAPKYGGGDWASVEGASDYYSSLKCLRRLFLNDDNQKILDGMTVDPIAVADCKAEHNNQQDELICIRSTMAALALAKVLGEGQTTEFRLDTPDPTQVSSTYSGHPQGQCRLDTLFHAALCRVPFSSDLSESDYQQGSCYTPSHAKGFRSRCWFKPN